jgi:PD-(D/E)XK endonuclease
MCSHLGHPTISSHPVDVGLRSEAAVLGRLVKHGYSVLLPWGVNQRYDLVIHDETDFVRVQCKTGRLRNGAVRFRTCSTRSNTRKALARDYAGEIDQFAVYCPDNDGVYLIPATAAPRREMFLRVERPRNSQSKHVRWAGEFELPA